MTERLYIRCVVCAAVTLIRVQVGWLDSHPISVPCGKCGITLSGTAYFNQKKATTRYEFPNAQRVQEEIPGHYLEVSGEFVTDKLKKYSGGPFLWSPPPFFQALWAMGGPDGHAAFKQKILQFLNFARHDWPSVKRINELWLGGQHRYLSKEVRRYLPREQFPLDNPAELLRGVHQLNLIFLWPILDQGRFEKTCKFLFRALPELAGRNSEGYVALLAFFSGRGRLERYEHKLLACIENFVLKFPYLVPVLSLRFYEKQPKRLLIEKGITTASFDDVKHFYAEMFEVATDVLPLVIAYNNLRYRRSFEVMEGRRRDVKTMQEFLKMRSKGERLQYLSGRESFNRLVSPNIDNQLRNAIAHAAYRYNAKKQLVTFYPSGIEGHGPVRRMYLLNFIQCCWSLFTSVVYLMEIVYQTRKMHFVIVKDYKAVHPNVFRSDI